MIVVDSSIALQWILPEAGNEAALGLLGRPDLMAPDILLIECANVLGKKIRAGDVTRDEAGTGLQIIRDAVETNVRSVDTVEQALSLSVELGHPVYDCCFLACALAGNATLATRDRPFMARLANHGYGEHLHFGSEAR